MTSEEDEQAFAVQEAIWKAVHELVDAATVTLTPEQDERVRQNLTETFRFWRRQS